MERDTSPRQDRMAGNWKQFRGKIKEKWGELTDDDLDRLEGRRDQLIGYLQEKSGQGREILERDVEDLSRATGYRWD